jgi:hypothetical protein
VIRSKEDQERIRQLIRARYGDAAVEQVNMDDFDRFDELYDVSDEKIIEYFKTEVVNGGLDIIKGKKTRASRDRVCGKCGKEEVFFTNKDMFYVIKHNVCERCYFKHIQ